jgi:hypothetical protein
MFVRQLLYKEEKAIVNLKLGETIVFIYLIILAHFCLLSLTILLYFLCQELRIKIKKFQ